MSQSITCLIIDDEPSAQKVLRHYVSDTNRLELVAVCDDAMEARSILTDRDIDLLLLDINMPRLSGISFLKTLQDPPAVVLTTAYDEFALEGYELDVVDYLLKPFSFERFVTAIGKVENRLYGDHTTRKDDLLVTADRKTFKIGYPEIEYIESLGDYVTIHYAGQSVTTYETLKNLEAQLPSTRFVRVHKSYIVALDKIDYLEGNRFVIGDQSIPIGSTYRERALSMFSD